MMTAPMVVGLAPENVEEAVAKAFATHGVQPEHVDGEALDDEGYAWRWRFRPGAPPVVDKEITTIQAAENEGRLAVERSYHPAIESGVAIEHPDVGWVVVFGDAGAPDADLIDSGEEEAAWRLAGPPGN